MHICRTILVAAATTAAISPRNNNFESPLSNKFSTLGTDTPSSLHRGGSNSLRNPSLSRQLQSAPPMATPSTPVPTKVPSEQPTTAPSQVPTNTPTATPTFNPTGSPTFDLRNSPLATPVTQQPKTSSEAPSTPPTVPFSGDTGDSFDLLMIALGAIGAVGSAVAIGATCN